MQGWQHQWDEFNHKSADPRQQAEVQQSRIQHLEQLMRRLTERTETLSTEVSSFQASPAEDEMDSIQILLNQAELSQVTLDNQRQDNSRAIELLRTEEKRAEGEHDAARSSQQTLKGRQASLLALQQAAMNDGAEQQWLVSKGLDGKPRLADSIETVSGWEVAVETVLGSYLQAIAVDDIASNIDLIKDFTKGELLLIGPGRGVEPGSASKGRLLSDLIKGEGAKSLLDSVYVADSLSDALKIQPKLSSGESVVTSDGIWLGANWLRVARDKDATAGVLKRKQELETIAGELEQLTVEIQQLETCRQGNAQNLKALEVTRQNIAMSIAEQQASYTELRSKLSGFEVQIEQYKARKERAENELAEVGQQTQVEKDNLSSARVILQQSIEMMEADAQTREQLIDQRDSFRGQLDSTREQAQIHRDTRQQLAVRESSLSTQLMSIRDGISRLESQLERLHERRNQLRVAFDIKEDPTEGHKEELEKQLEMLSLIHI